MGGEIGKTGVSSQVTCGSIGLCMPEDSVEEFSLVYGSDACGKGGCLGGAA